MEGGRTFYPAGELQTHFLLPYPSLSAHPMPDYAVLCCAVLLPHYKTDRQTDGQFVQNLIYFPSTMYSE
jgi:hypothetical protein